MRNEEETEELSFNLIQTMNKFNSNLNDNQEN